jgi:hypothetical protein
LGFSRPSKTVFAQELGKGGCNGSVIFDKLPIEARKAKEAKTASDPSVFGKGHRADPAVYDTPVDRETVLYGVKAPGMLVFSIVALASAIGTYLLITFFDLEAFL